MSSEPQIYKEWSVNWQGWFENRDSSHIFGHWFAVHTQFGERVSIMVDGDGSLTSESPDDAKENAKQAGYRQLIALIDEPETNGEILPV